MSNIEDDIKYVKEMLEIAKVFFMEVKAETDYKDIDEIAFGNAIRNILSEREQNIKKIKELEEENKALELQNKQLEYYIEELKKYNKTVSDRIIEYKKNSIPKQKIKEKIEKVTLSGGGNGKDNVENSARELVIEVLQELLEGEVK